MTLSSSRQLRLRGLITCQRGFESQSLSTEIKGNFIKTSKHTECRVRHLRIKQKPEKYVKGKNKRWTLYRALRRRKPCLQLLLLSIIKQTKFSGIEQQPFYYSHSSCGPEIWKGLTEVACRCPSMFRLHLGRLEGWR